MRLNVYEARNNTLREILVGVTDLPVTDLAQTHQQRRISQILHWDFCSHQIQYVEVEASLPERDAKTFMKAYASNMPLRGWKMLLAQT